MNRENTSLIRLFDAEPKKIKEDNSEEGSGLKAMKP